MYEHPGHSIRKLTPSLTANDWLAWRWALRVIVLGSGYAVAIGSTCRRVCVMIPISAVVLGAEIEDLVLQVLRSGTLAQGPKVEQLECEFAAMIGVDHVVAVNSGSTALTAALRALEIGPGDTVITSPFTFVATLNAILEVGATARFADISEDDFCLTAANVEPLIDASTVAIMPVHLYGQAANMPELSEVAQRNGLAIVEDAAQAHGATVAGRATGSWGVGCFSLYATKNLAAGEGGLISTNNAQLADRLRVLRNQGMRKRYEYEMAGSNYRLTDLQAAVCLPQLKHYDESVRIRRRNADLLSAGLAGLEYARTPYELPGREHVWHQYTVLIAEDAPISRDDLAEQLLERGVGSGIYYPRPVFDYACYRDDQRVLNASVPIATSISRRCLSLPVHPGVSESDVEQIIEAVTEVLAAR
jgi:perosamine synthetase